MSEFSIQRLFEMYQNWGFGLKISFLATPLLTTSQTVQGFNEQIFTINLTAI
jgi:hypothetical protein